MCVAWYAATLFAGYLLMLTAGIWMWRLLRHNLLDDVFNDENESFMQETRLIENEYSVNLPTLFRYQGRTWQGWLNIPAVFRAVAVIGSPGSGKSFTVINNFIRQFIEKSFCLYIYDFKYPDLSTLAYNHLLRYKDRYEVTPQFCVINFDDPRHSHRCNPLKAEFLTDIADSYEAANVTMLGLNRSWSQKQGDFFIESSVILFAAIIWFLKIYENGKYCTFPHAVELLMQKYEEVFTILMARPELEGYVSAFVDAWKSGAVEQLAGQVASTKIALSRIISPSLYWVMSGDDFSLDINNPKAPKILCVGNNPERVAIYGAALSLYNSRIVKMINRKGQQKCGVIVDELPTIFSKVWTSWSPRPEATASPCAWACRTFPSLRATMANRKARSYKISSATSFQGRSWATQPASSPSDSGRSCSSGSRSTSTEKINPRV